MSKLYTEEQVREAIELAREKYPNNITLTTKGIMHQLTPIELPTDEEIEIAALPYVQDLAFKCGAKWMRDKIKGGEND